MMGPRHVGILAVALVLAGCGRGQQAAPEPPPAVQAAAPEPAAPQVEPAAIPLSELPADATIREIMDLVVDPAGDFLFASVAEVSDDKGMRLKAPQTEAEWAAVRRHLQLLADAPNLLVAPGRKAARPGDRTAHPEIENQPEEVQRLMDVQHADFVRRARALQTAAGVGLSTAAARDPRALMTALVAVDHACESCHLHYWYPRDQRAQQAAKEEGVQ